MLWLCARFRESGPGREIVIAIDFEGDATTQSLGQQLLQRIGRPAKKRLATEVVAQSARFVVVGLEGGAQNSWPMSHGFVIRWRS